MRVSDMFNANETFRDANFLMFFLTLLVCEVGGTMIFRTQFETAVYVKNSFYVPSLYVRERERERERESHHYKGHTSIENPASFYFIFNILIIICI
jgi:hypothetical protein